MAENEIKVTEQTDMDKITTGMMEHICDEICQHSNNGRLNQDELDDICAECKMGQFVCDILNAYNRLNEFDKTQSYDLLKKLSEYRNLEEQGLLLKLPCNVGDTVKLNACCECISILPNTICPFESDCDCEDCGSGNERGFTTTIESIYNNGSGWYMTLKHFDIEIPISDFGRTIFLTEQEAQAALERMERK